MTLEARAASNSNAKQKPLTTMVRIWQLKSVGEVATIDYNTLLDNAENILKDSVIDSREFLIMPQSTVDFTMPMHDATQVIVIVGLFNRPNLATNDWRLLITREELDADKPRVIQFSDNRLILLPKK